jgi:hypothetical protein
MKRTISYLAIAGASCVVTVPTGIYLCLNDSYITSLSDEKLQTSYVEPQLSMKALFREKVTKFESCTTKMCRTLTFPLAYAFHKIYATPTRIRNTDRVLSVTGGFCGGIMAAANWPISLPIATVAFAEHKLGWKIC